MTKTYKLLKEMPNHQVGELLYKPFDDAKYYEWVKEPHYRLEDMMVEKSPDFFEEIVSNWEIGENIYFISMDGEVIDEEFHPARHSRLVQFGNAFKEKNVAQYIKEQLKKLYSGKGSTVITRDNIFPILNQLCQGNIDKVKEMLEKFI